MEFEKYLTVAKVVYDNMPFENDSFKVDSVNDCARKLKALVGIKHLSQSWIDDVYEAAEKNQPIYIQFMENGNWNFLTMKSGTREDIIEEIRKIDVDKIVVKVKSND